jgi:dolichol-phosphate mannosyltransferase
MLHSVVIPLYQCASWVDELVRRVDETMKGAALEYELVLVDDGSRDETYARALALLEKGYPLRLFRLSRNFGHQEAIGIGLQMAKGERIAVLDDDLQDPPELLPKMFARLDEGWDVVYGVRESRVERGALKTLFFLFYRVLDLLSELEIPLDAGDFCCMRRNVVDAMLSLRDPAPFWRGSRAWVGFRQVGYEYDRPARPHGSRAYDLKKYLRLAMAGFIGYSFRPLRFATWLGALLGLGSVCFAIYVIFWRVLGHEELPGYASLAVLIAFLGSAQLLCLGIVGEYLARLCQISRRWPQGIVSEARDKNTPAS